MIKLLLIHTIILVLSWLILYPSDTVLYYVQEKWGFEYKDFLNGVMFIQIGIMLVECLIWVILFL